MRATLLASAAVMAACGFAHAAPSQLYGKSVVVTWTEDQEQRVGGNPEPRHVGRNGTFSVYLSAAGRPFSRMNFSFAGNGNSRSGSRDAVGSGGNRSVSFSAGGLSADMQMGGGVRHVAVSFDSGFAGCSAQVLTGKESGAGSIHAHSLVSPGMPVEILSVKTGAASCRIQDGNVFGG